MDEAEKAENEITTIITHKIMPSFVTLKATYDRATLWRKLGCSGMTEEQRKQYLSLLENVDK